MSTHAVGWAPSNRWFKLGFDQSIPFVLDDITIRILSLPYFLATKMEALFDRGIKDLHMSHDLEDIVYLLNYTTDITEQVLGSDDGVKKYLQDRFLQMIGNDNILNVMPGSLYYEQVEAWMEIILDRMQKVIEGK